MKLKSRTSYKTQDGHKVFTVGFIVSDCIKYFIVSRFIEFTDEGAEIWYTETETYTPEGEAICTAHGLLRSNDNIIAEWTAEDERQLHAKLK
jgi:hypothetical protein